MTRLVLLVIAVMACTDAAEPMGEDNVDVDGKADSVGGRPFRLVVPPGKEPRPLVLSLHGYSSSGSIITEYFGLEALAYREGFLLAIPEGTRDTLGNQFWNTGLTCCDFFESNVDDFAYLAQLIDQVEARHAISHIYVVGHSNGAFMAHRLACGLSSRIDGIVSLAGAAPLLSCPGRGVRVLEIHGDQDPVIRYGGGSFGSEETTYPSAPTTAAGWAARNGCPITSQETFAIDLDVAIGGSETTVDRYCPTVELWTVHGGGHSPTLVPDFASRVYSFLRGGATPCLVASPSCPS